MAKKDFQCVQRHADMESLKSMTMEESKQVLAALSKGIAHPARVQIVNILANKSCEQRCICGDIVNALPLAQSSVSQHLRVLKKTGWIQGKISGPSVCYCLVDGIVDFYRSLLTQAIGIE